MALSIKGVSACTNLVSKSDNSKLKIGGFDQHVYILVANQFRLSNDCHMQLSAWEYALTEQ